MYWKESGAGTEDRDHASVVDVVFRIQCPRLVADHAHDLLQAVVSSLPWFSDEKAAGIHSIHGADSGNGWYRPAQEDGAVLQLSRRVRLILRVPETRVAQCVTLCGATLTVSEYSITINDYNLRVINPAPTLFARSMVTAVDETEEAFVEKIHARLANTGIDAPKILPGLKHRIRLADRYLLVRSLLLADVTISDSIRLQEVGLEENRKLGCGLFVPYKSITSVRSAEYE